MPAGSRGPLGYADYQRLDNKYGNLLAKWSGVEPEAGKSYGLYDVSRYSDLAIWAYCKEAPALMTVQWFSKEPETLEMGQSVIVLSPSIANPLVLRVPNLGPLVSVALAYTATKERTQVFGQILPSNVPSPLPITPTSSVLIPYQVHKLAGEATATVYPTSYYAGPLQFFFGDGVGATLLALEGLTASGTWEALAEERTAAATAYYTLKWVAPTGAWRIKVANLTKVENPCAFTVIASMTGST